MASTLHLAAEDVMKKNHVQKKEYSHSVMKHRRGIQKIKGLKCGNFITQKFTKEKV